MECLQESIKCKLCYQLLEKPVLLPCGNVICQKHQHESQENQSGIYCTVCDLNHEIPPNGGFVRIIPLENLINQNIDHIDFGEEYQLAYEKLNSFSDLLKRFEQLKNDPEYVISAKISELKAEIDLRREELKNQIDEEALAFIKKLDDYEVECKENIPSIKLEIEKSDKLKEWKEDLDRWQQQMRTFKKDNEMWKKIYDEANRKYHQIDSHVLNLDYDIFLERFFEYQELKHLIGCDRDMIK
jgi:hypothetical protein